jgi:predicted RNase H-like nuclease
MNRTGEPSVAELKAQLAAHAAEIAALKAEKETLSQRVVKLEEELALARLHRFAPRSEKHVDRIFNEAEQVADEDEREMTCRKDCPSDLHLGPAVLRPSITKAPQSVHRPFSFTAR